MLALLKPLVILVALLMRALLLLLLLARILASLLLLARTPASLLLMLLLSFVDCQHVHIALKLVNRNHAVHKEHGCIRCR